MIASYAFGEEAMFRDAVMASLRDGEAAVRLAGIECGRLAFDPDGALTSVLAQRERGDELHSETRLSRWTLEILRSWLDQ